MCQRFRQGYDNFEHFRNLPTLIVPPKGISVNGCADMIRNSLYTAA